MLLGVNVDDLIVAGSNEDCQGLCGILRDDFPINNLEHLTWYDGKSVKVVQTAYMDRLIKCFNIGNHSTCTASASVKLGSRKADDSEVEEPYRQAEGSLIWLANMSRPDIASAVRDVARYMSNPNTQYWTAVIKILRYLKRTRLDGLVLGGGGRGEVHVCVDSKYARDPDDKHSVSGAAVMSGDAAISWFSRVQSCVATSSSEAEYVTMGDVVKEAMYVRGVLKFLEPLVGERNIVIDEDNEGAIQLASNPFSSPRSRHLDERHHFERQLVLQGVVRVENVCSEAQHADILAKPVEGGLFKTTRIFFLNSAE